jgi:hypothetical protein
MIRLARVTLGLLLALALVACGPGGGGTAQPAGSTPPSAPAASGGY